MIKSTRQLAAIMFTDIVGYTALMGSDEQKALTLLHKNREIHETCIASHGGKLLKEMGDGILAQFNSALDAVQCALEIQQLAGTSIEGHLRIGIHLGDVVIEHDDVFGDGVNIASRLQSIADPGGIYISESVQKAIRSRSDVLTLYLDDVELKNVDYPVKTYALQGDGLPVTSLAKIKSLSGRGSRRKRIFKSPHSYIIIVVLGILFVTSRWWFPNVNDDGVRLAVLPIENLSGEDDGEILVAGIHSTLIDEIGKISALHVISKTSSKKYRDEEKTIPEIANELNIDMVVESELIRMDDSVLLQFRLIQAFPEEQQLWSKSYSKPTKNVLTLYNEVAFEISQAINIELTPQEKTQLTSAREVNPDAYRAYLKSQFHYNNFTRHDFTLALQSLDLALKYDPDYLEAFIGIAQVWTAIAQMGIVPYAVAYPNIKAAEQKALSFNIESAEIHNMLAFILAFVEWDWEHGALEFQKAIALNSNYSEARNAYSYLLAIMSHHDEAKIQIDLALELDPFNPFFESFYGWNLLYARQYEDAIEHCQKSLSLAPEMWVAQDALRQAFHMLGRFDEAYDLTKALYADQEMTDIAEALELGYAKGGYSGAMSLAAEALVTRSKSSFVSPESIAEMYAYAGNKDEVLEWLEKAFEIHDNDIHYLAVVPIYDALRGEPRFQELVKKINLPQKED